MLGGGPADGGWTVTAFQGKQFRCQGRLWGVMPGASGSGSARPVQDSGTHIAHINTLAERVSSKQGEWPADHQSVYIWLASSTSSWEDGRKLETKNVAFSYIPSLRLGTPRFQSVP